MSASLAVVAAVKFIQPSLTYDPTLDPFWRFTGGIVFVATVPLTVACFLILYRIARQPSSSSSDARGAVFAAHEYEGRDSPVARKTAVKSVVLSSFSSLPHHSHTHSAPDSPSSREPLLKKYGNLSPVTLRDNLPRLLLLLLLLATCFGLCIALSCIWNYGGPSWFPSTSVWAWWNVQVNDRFYLKV